MRDRIRSRRAAAYGSREDRLERQAPAAHHAGAYPRGCDDAWPRCGEPADAPRPRRSRSSRGSRGRAATCGSRATRSRSAGRALVTLALLPFRDDLTPLSKGFGYLVRRRRGRGDRRARARASLASVLGFLAFNFFFLPPYGTVRRSAGRSTSWSCSSFLGLSVLISELLARAAERARGRRGARGRAADDPGAEPRAHDSACPGEDTYEAALTRVMRRVRLRGGRAVRRADRGRSRAGRAGHGRRRRRARSTRDWDPASAGAAARTAPAVRRRTDARAGRAARATGRRSRRPRAACSARSATSSPSCSSATGCCEPPPRPRSTGRRRACRRSLLAAVSHDLRSPLAAIKASVDRPARRRVAGDHERGPARGARWRSTPRPTG